MNEAHTRYLEILGIEPAVPSHGFLETLVRTQLFRVPFENVSKLLHARVQGRRFMPDLVTHFEMPADRVREATAGVNLGGDIYI